MPPVQSKHSALRVLQAVVLRQLLPPNTGCYSDGGGKTASYWSSSCGIFSLCTDFLLSSSFLPVLSSFVTSFSQASLSLNRCRDWERKENFKANIYILKKDKSSKTIFLTNNSLIWKENFPSRFLFAALVCGRWWMAWETFSSYLSWQKQSQGWKPHSFISQVGKKFLGVQCWTAGGWWKTGVGEGPSGWV